MYKLIYFIDKLNYIWWCLEGTLLFWLINIPLFLSLFALKITFQSLPFLFIVSLPVGPSLQALMQSMKQVEETNKLMKPFFKYLTSDWLKSLVIWLPTQVIMSLAIANIFLMTKVGINGFIYVINLLIVVLVLTVTLNFYLLNAYFPRVLFKNGLMTTVKLMVLKSGRSTMSFMICLGIVIIMKNLSVYLLFLGVGIIVILLLLNYKVIADYVESHIKD